MDSVSVYVEQIEPLVAKIEMGDDFGPAEQLVCMLSKLSLWQLGLRWRMSLAQPSQLLFVSQYWQ